MSRRSERCRHQPLLEADAHKPVEEIQAPHPTLHGPRRKSHSTNAIRSGSSIARAQPRVTDVEEAGPRPRRPGDGAAGVSYYILRVASRREERLGQQALRETDPAPVPTGAGFPSAQPGERVLHAALLGNSSRHTRTGLT